MTVSRDPEQSIMEYEVELVGESTNATSNETLPQSDSEMETGFSHDEPHVHPDGRIEGGQYPPDYYMYIPTHDPMSWGEGQRAIEEFTWLSDHTSDAEEPKTPNTRPGPIPHHRPADKFVHMNLDLDMDWGFDFHADPMQPRQGNSRGPDARHRSIRRPIARRLFPNAKRPLVAASSSASNSVNPFATDLDFSGSAFSRNPFTSATDSGKAPVTDTAKDESSESHQSTGPTTRSMSRKSMTRFQAGTAHEVGEDVVMADYHQDQ